ncbi:DUF305 domain-containing protein [Mycolicibacterium wolinskyi]|uniref:DUF305 domain-containing protein n=1 Tax=Mycolicibacterium wolinskyi TaxID=59750 RepID=A0A1X2F5P8_9MYCO|nr:MULTISPECIES: DUF305 domain-containing protein [Mycolicibacterium]MCV7289057.1 DUF305 domain-containing protein [Mycolicibacterium wolinskyi]MCV7296484.1 DUF305 domain-containing protein [Mycolicibacterium goodii]ORX13309.1 DUF305 domain-containing protein [Mycolicibacterium wolinskyi]
MWKRTTLVGAGALVAVAVAAGCSNTSETQPTAAGPSASVTASSEVSAQSQAHNDADVMFAQHMIPHHQQAVEMSDMLLAKQGIDPRVTDLATQIKGAQGPEIEQMQRWLDQWGNPPMPPMTGGHGNMDHGNMSGGMAGMQGMMSEADMTALRNAQGVEAAKLFLTQMIAHHEGAITMAQDEIDGGQFPDAVEMARTIVTTQQQEIDAMRGLLGSL